MPAMPNTLVLVGGGKMGSALLEGWLKIGLGPHSVTIIDPGLSEASRAAFIRLGVAVTESPARLPPADVVVLAIKPQMLDEAGPGLAQLFSPNTLLVSVVAGKRIVDLSARIPTARRIVRTMPNTPAAVGKGITALFAPREIDEDGRLMAETLLAAVGQVAWLPEEGLIDAVTALSGSGPAYVFHLVEAMAAAGEAVGLSPDLSMRLARQTVIGAGALLEQSPEDAATLRRNVTSPGGTTAAALSHLMDESRGLAQLMARAIAAARDRAVELSG